MFYSIKTTLTNTLPASYSSKYSLSPFISNSKLLYEPIFNSYKERCYLPPKVYNLVSVAGLKSLNLVFSFFTSGAILKISLAFYKAELRLLLLYSSICFTYNWWHIFKTIKLYKLFIFISSFCSYKAFYF